ncbi:hypothetical protein PGB34_13600 [Xenophilus arseniciresistens]|uniref:Uncharacterized protein n=1 Tax=Xenophilus arseniciresistens TaxID=1283306 RepID=A0AAE3NA52_9BURK|nr:hypothetical protein [Xenophilus arseniciresistens]MDA7417399.1 hypothetical protein [Xenophilus arseniciresistens]
MKNDQMLLRGMACALIGVAVLLGPYVMRSAGWREMLASAQTVGWFALVLGVALMVVALVRKKPRK